MNERIDRGDDAHELPTDDPNATSDAPAPIHVDVDPNDQRLEGVEESVERAAR